jgi:hypothetical protein
MKNLEQYLKEVKGRSGEATKGPWHKSWFSYSYYKVSDDASSETICTVHTLPHSVIEDDKTEATADFIAHSRTDIDKLAAMVEKCVTAFEEMGNTNQDHQCICGQIARDYLAQLDRMAGE